MSNFDPKSIPKDLIEGFQRNICGIFVGAGLSITAGLPTWKEFISELIDLASKIQDFPQDRIEEFKKLSGQLPKFLLLAEELKEILADDFRKYIVRRFVDEAPEPSSTHTELIQLPYRFIVTTNYDSLIEKAYFIQFADLPTTITYKEPEAVSYNLWHSRKFILKAHGDAKTAPQNIILTNKDYRQIIFREPGYQSMLQTLFSTNSILFLGSSFDDPDLSVLLGYIQNAFYEGGPSHFALIDKANISQTESKRWSKDYNVKIISYDSANNNQQVLQFLKALTEKLNQSITLNSPSIRSAQFST